MQKRDRDILHRTPCLGARVWAGAGLGTASFASHGALHQSAPAGIGGVENLQVVGIWHLDSSPFIFIFIFEHARLVYIVFMTLRFESSRVREFESF